MLIIRSKRLALIVRSICITIGFFFLGIILIQTISNLQHGTLWGGTIIPESYAVTIPNQIGIILDNGCIVAEKAHLKTDCPTYKDIVNYDTSNQAISGKFVNDNGFYHRENTKFKSNLNFYAYDTTPRVFVDPPKDMLDKIPIIILSPNLGTFATIDDLEAGQGNNRVLHAERFVQACEYQTIIRYSPVMLNDTIHYIQSGCTTTNINTTKSVTHVFTYTDPTTTESYKNQQWVKTAITKTAVKDCRYVKCDVVSTGKKW